MNQKNCIDTGQLDEALRSPEWGEHLRSCTRCSTLVREYEIFLAAEDVVGAKPADAERELSTLFAPTTPRRALGQRPALMGFALAAAIAAILFLPRGGEVPEAPVLRDTGTDAIGLLPLGESEESWQLRWSAHPDADAYELRIYDVELRELLRVGPLLRPEADVGKADLELEPTLLWRVHALSAGDEIWRSEVGVLRQSD